MIEVGILAGITLALGGSGLACWRLICGPAERRTGLALRVAVVGLMSVVLVSASTWRLIKSRDFQCFGGLVPRVDTSVPTIALTFDDGPSSEFTDQILADLREHDVKATFFVTGQALEENMAAAQRIVEEGHELGNHSYSHQHMVVKLCTFVQQEIERTDQLIREAGYEGDIHFRSPYGKKLIVLPYYLHRTGRLNVFMDIEPESYREVAADADAIVEHVLERVQPGSIILLHVMPKSRVESRKALPTIIQGLKERGYDFVTVSDLLALRPSSTTTVVENE